MPRDDFPKTTINLLRKRAAGHCSNPDCQVATEGPGKDPDVAITTGIAAHIKAASPGGPRYDPGMTKAQRQSHENGIWLCAGCATRIDRDVSGHPVDLLIGWRSQAEDWACSQINRRPAREKDAVALLAGALSGSPASLSPTAIKNVHLATSQALERLDTRFHVTSTFDGEATKFTLNVKEPVDIRFNVPIADSPEWNKQLSALREYGEVATLPIASVTVLGSPLIQAVLDDGARSGGKLRFSPPSHLMSVTLIARDSEGRSKRLVRGKGELVAGLSTMTFRASLFDGIVSFSLKRSLAPGAAEGTFTLGTDLLGWGGQDVRDLSELDEFNEFADGLSSAHEVDAQLHKGGSMIFGGVMKTRDFDLPGDGIQAFLRHTLAVREIAIGLGTCIRVALGPCSKSESAKVKEVADIVSGRRVLVASDLSSNPRCAVEIDDQSAFNQLVNTNQPVTIRYVAQESSRLRVFDQDVELPPLEVTLESTRANVIGATPTERGKLVDIEWLQEPGFRCTFRYVTSTAQCATRS